VSYVSYVKSPTNRQIIINPLTEPCSIAMLNNHGPHGVSFPLVSYLRHLPGSARQ
jgi:hypothetical protein